MEDIWNISKTDFADLPTTRRDKEMLCGLVLSKFRREGFEKLGLCSYKEAYNVLGYSLGTKPMTIKNYRDEFDPYFPNDRKGWDNRKVRPHIQNLVEMYGQRSLNELAALVLRLTCPAATTLMSDPPDSLEIEDPATSSYARRIITGKAAEEYFRRHYLNLAQFKCGKLWDTTAFGCGYDFEVGFRNGDATLAVEVKGIRERAGSILLSEKEGKTALALRDRYYLCVVSGFNESPSATLWKDPLNSDIVWNTHLRKVEEVQWRATL